MTPGVDTIVIVDPSIKPPEGWYCVATNAPSAPWWQILLTKAGKYRLAPMASTDRSRLLAAVRKGECEWLNQFKGLGWVAVAAHPEHSVLLPGDPTTFGPDAYIPMTPKRIPFCGTENEVFDRVRLAAARDKQFARKWAGWRFLAIRHDDGVLL